MKQDVIQPIEKSLLRQEISTLTKLCDSLHGGYELYVFTSHQCPNLMQELGRLRQIAYRVDDIGTDEPIYADEFDFMDSPYKQLIVWDDRTSSILGSYRFVFGCDIKILDNGKPHMRTCNIYDLSERFVRDYLPYTTEWSCAFVANDYQVTGGAAASPFVLSSLWDGFAVIFKSNPHIKYILGNASIPCIAPTELADLLSYYVGKYHPSEGLGAAKTPRKMRMTEQQAAEIISADNRKDAYRKMNIYLKGLGIHIPPLINSYFATSSNIKCLRVAKNPKCNEYVLGMFGTIAGIGQDKWDVHYKGDNLK